MTNIKKRVITSLLIVSIITMAILWSTFLLKNERHSIKEPNSDEFMPIQKEEIIDNKIYNMPDSLILTNQNALADNSAYISSSINLKAKIIPEDAYDTRVIWSLEWANLSNPKILDKNANSYINTLIDPNDNNVINVRLNKPFSEKILLLATSVENTNVSSTCTIDCLQSPQFAKLSLNYDNGYVANSRDSISASDNLIKFYDDDASAFSPTLNLRYFSEYTIPYTQNPRLEITLIDTSFWWQSNSSYFKHTIPSFDNIKKLELTNNKLYFDDFVKTMAGKYNPHIVSDDVEASYDYFISQQGTIMMSIYSFNSDPWAGDLHPIVINVKAYPFADKDIYWNYDFNFRFLRNLV